MRLIDADEAIYIATNHLINPYEIISFRAVIDKTPTIGIESLMKHGKWIETEYKPHVYCKCSLCGHREKINDKSNYCPNCGAKMDLEGK